MPRIFVGTLYCGEGDFTLACDAISRQAGVHVDHIVISNLSEREAHNKLWQSWRDVQYNGYDFFVKVDADTVLAHDNVFLDIWKMLSYNERITGIQSPLHDHFTNEFINGLNCFTPKVVFKDSKYDLFCDRQVDFNHDIVIKADGVVDSLKPAGYHCHNASNIQSFHFGLHRMLKRQFDIIEKVKKNFKQEVTQSNEAFAFNTKRSYALLGALLANNFSNNRKFNYTDIELHEAFEYADAHKKDILNEI